jgi:hypothetical protein
MSEENKEVPAETPAATESGEPSKAPPVAEMSDEEKQIEQKMIKMIQKMPKNVQDRFKALKILSDRRSKDSDQHEIESKKVSLDLENTMRKPLYEKRRLIISGETTDFADYTSKYNDNNTKLIEEVAKIEAEEKKEKKEGEEDKKDDEESEYKKPDLEYLKGIQGIPDFWHKAVKNNAMFSEMIKDKDDSVLKHLKHVETETAFNP